MSSSNDPSSGYKKIFKLKYIIDKKPLESNSVFLALQEFKGTPTQK